MVTPDDPKNASGDGEAGEAMSRSELRSKTLAGIRWVTLARIVAEVLALASSVVLARLISPAEFGRAAIALLAVAIAGAVLSQGIGAALVQLPAAKREDFRSASLLAGVTGVVLAAAGAAVGAFVAPDFLGERVGELITLSSVSFLIVPIGTVANARMQRELDFRRLTKIEVTSLFAGTATGVVLAAVFDLNGDALVLAVVTSGAVASLLYALSAPLTRPGFDGAAVRRLAAFAVPSGLAALSYTVFRRIDYVILGSRLSAADVGYYWRAYQLGVEYQSKVTTIMLKIAFPVFSRTRNLEDMRAVRARIVRLHASVVLPPLATFIAIAPVLIPWLYGDAWEPSVEPAQLLAVIGMGAAVVTGIGPLLMAAGKARELMIFNLVTLATYAAAVWIAASEGLIAVCLAVLGVQTVNFLFTQYFLLDRLLGIPARQLRSEVAPGFIASVCLLAVTYPLVDRMSAAGVDALPILLAAGAIAAAISVALIRRFFPAAWRDILLVLRLVRQGRSQAGLRQT